jgi:hypothetical protein
LAVLAQQSAPARKKQAPAQQNPAKLSPAAEDVQSAVNRLRNSLVTECVGHTYVLLDGSKEVRQFSIRALPWQVTEADSLNSIDWVGELVLTATASRKALEADPPGWKSTTSMNHLTGQDFRTERSYFEGACGKCVLVPHEIATFGAYRANRVWHYFKPTVDSAGDALGYRVFPARGQEIDLDANAEKPGCTAFPETVEFKEMQRNEAEAAAQAQRDHALGFWTDKSTGLMWTVSVFERI